MQFKYYRSAKYYDLIKIRRHCSLGVITSLFVEYDIFNGRRTAVKKYLCLIVLTNYREHYNVLFTSTLVKSSTLQQGPVLRICVH